MNWRSLISPCVIYISTYESYTAHLNFSLGSQLALVVFLQITENAEQVCSLMEEIDGRRTKFPLLCTCHRLPPGVGPRANQGNMSGIQVDGLDSLPLGRGKFARFFQVRRKGVGEYEIL